MTDQAVLIKETLTNLEGPIRRLSRSLANGHGRFPLRTPVFDSASEDEIDQFLQRFQQVADIMLRKLFPRTASYFSGAPSPAYFRDVLDLLERAEILDSATWWADLNDRRNRLIHEYAMKPDVRLDEINQAWAAAPNLVAQTAIIQKLVTRT